MSNAFQVGTRVITTRMEEYGVRAKNADHILAIQAIRKAGWTGLVTTAVTTRGSGIRLRGRLTQQREASETTVEQLLVKRQGSETSITYSVNGVERIDVY